MIPSHVYVLMENDYPRHVFAAEASADAERRRLEYEEAQRLAAGGDRRRYYHVQRVELS